MLPAIPCQADRFQGWWEINVAEWPFKNRDGDGMSGEAVGISRAGESMEPKVIISFATGTFCAYEKFGNSSEGDCNT